MKHYQKVKVIDTPNENLYTVPSVQTGPTLVFSGQVQSQRKGELKMCADVLKGGEPPKKKKAKKKAAPKKAAKKKAAKKK
jgi:hypothetical protein